MYDNPSGFKVNPAVEGGSRLGVLPKHQSTFLVLRHVPVGGGEESVEFTHHPGR